MSTKMYYVYILSNARGAIYIGVTNDLKRRIAEHKSGKVAGFATKYRIDRLVYYEEFKYVADATEAEKRIKELLRKRKLELVRELNPTFRDLSEDLPIN